MGGESGGMANRLGDGWQPAGLVMAGEGGGMANRLGDCWQPAG
jgi:hypothetical protein